MSYVENIKPNEKDNFKTIYNWELIFKKSTKDFEIRFPDKDLGSAELKIENKIFTSNCEFKGDYKSNIEFKNCYFKNDVSFYEVTFQKDIIFNHCFFDNDINIYKTANFLGTFDFINRFEKRQLYIHGGSFAGKCNWSIIDNSRVVLNGCAFKDFKIGSWGGTFLKELSIHCEEIAGLIRVFGEKSRIEQLNLSQFSNDVSLSFEDINVNTVSIYRFRNEKSLRF